MVDVLVARVPPVVLLLQVLKELFPHFRRDAVRDCRWDIGRVLNLERFRADPGATALSVELCDFRKVDCRLPNDDILVRDFASISISSAFDLMSQQFTQLQACEPA